MGKARVTGWYLRAAAAGAVLAGLVACDLLLPPTPLPPADETERGAPTPAATRPPPRPERKPSVPGAAPAETQSAEAPSPETAPVETAPVETAATEARPPQTAPTETASVEAANPDRLIGLDQAQTKALLGEPKVRTELSPATIWRYVGQNCELEVYFYLDLQSRVMRALQYEVRSHDSANPARNRCFAELVAERRADAVR